MSTSKPLLPGLLLLTAWGLVLVLLVPMASIMSSDPLGFYSQSLHFLICLPVFVCSIWYYRSSANAWHQSFEIGWARKLPAALVLIFAVPLLALQFIPGDIDGTFTDDSPFDHFWFSVKQTCFGYPFTVCEFWPGPSPRLADGSSILTACGAT